MIKVTCKWSCQGFNSKLGFMTMQLPQKVPYDKPLISTHDARSLGELNQIRKEPRSENKKTISCIKISKPGISVVFSDETADWNTATILIVSTTFALLAISTLRRVTSFLDGGKKACPPSAEEPASSHWQLEVIDL